LVRRQYVLVWVISGSSDSGDPVTLYFQILDTRPGNQSATAQGAYLFSGITPVGTTAGLRYLVGIGSQNQPYGITVTFPSIDRTKVLTYIAVQADPNDSSIWQRDPASFRYSCGRLRSVCNSRRIEHSPL
jgi:hypothetical protein